MYSIEEKAMAFAQAYLAWDRETQLLAYERYPVSTPVMLHIAGGHLMFTKKAGPLIDICEAMFSDLWPDTED